MNQRLLTDAASIVSLPKLFSFAETFDHHDDHHPVLLEMGRLHGTIDLFKQAEILHGIDCHQIICRRWI